MAREILIGHKEKVKTKVLREVDFDKKYRLSIEKIVEPNHRFENYYMIKSFTKGLLGYKINSLAAWDVQSDEDSHEFIESFQFKPFRMLDQAVDYAKYIKKTKYPTWLRYQ